MEYTNCMDKICMIGYIFVCADCSYLRVERTGSREHIQVYYSHEAGPVEVKACKEAVSVYCKKCQ